MFDQESAKLTIASTSEATGPETTEWQVDMRTAVMMVSLDSILVEIIDLSGGVKFLVGSKRCTAMR